MYRMIPALLGSIGLIGMDLSRSAESAPLGLLDDVISVRRGAPEAYQSRSAGGRAKRRWKRARAAGRAKS